MVVVDLFRFCRLYRKKGGECKEQRPQQQQQQRQETTIILVSIVLAVYFSVGTDENIPIHPFGALKHM
jgi:hypothetical protein